MDEKPELPGHRTRLFRRTIGQSVTVRSSVDIEQAAYETFNKKRKNIGLGPLAFEKYKERMNKRSISEQLSSPEVRRLMGLKSISVHECPVKMLDYDKKNHYQRAVREWRAGIVPAHYISSQMLNREHGLEEVDFYYIKSVIEYEKGVVCYLILMESGQTVYYYDPHWIADLFPPEHLERSGLIKYYVDTGI